MNSPSRSGFFTRSRRARIVAAVLAAVLVAALVAALAWRGCRRTPLPKRTPYRMLSAQELMERLESPGCPNRRQIAEALVMLGDQAEPAVARLVEMAESGDWLDRLYAVIHLGEMGPVAKEAAGPLVRIMRTERGRLAVEAATALGRIGAVNDDVVPALTAVLFPAERRRWETDEGPLPREELQMAAIVSLGRIGPRAESAALPITLAMVRLYWRFASGYWSAVRALGQLGPGARIAAPALRHQFLEDRNEELSWLVAASLSKIGYAAEFDPILIRAARGYAADGKTIESDDRLAAIGALGEFSSEKRAFTAVLLEALKDKNQAVRRAAAGAMGTMRPVSVEIVTALVRAMRADPGARGAAAESLARMGPQGGTAVTDLLAMLASPDADLRKHAAVALGGMGMAGESAVDALAKMLTDKDDDVAVAAAGAIRTLGSAGGEGAAAMVQAARSRGTRTRGAVAIMEQVDLMGLNARAAVRDLVQGLDSSDLEHRRACCEALASIGPDAKDAVGALIEASTDHDKEVRKSALAALGRMGPVTEEVVPALLRVLRDESLGMRTEAAGALGNVGPEAHPAVPDLMAMLGGDGMGDGSAASSALSKIGPTTVDGLLVMLKAGKPRVRALAAGTLGEMGPAAGRAAPQLVAALADPRAEVRIGAYKALERIGPAGKGVVPALTELLTEDDRELRASAAAALTGVGPKAKAAYLPLLLAVDGLRWSPQLVEDSLADLGPPTESDVPALTQAVLRGGERARAYAIAALAKIGPAGVVALCATIETAGTELRKDVLEQLFRSPPRHEAAMAQILPALKDEDSDVRRRAVAVWCRLAASARSAGAETPRRIRPDDPDVIAAVIRVLSDGDWRFGENRIMVEAAFCAIGRPAVAPLLAATKTDAKQPVRARFIAALGYIGPAAAGAVGRLIELLDATPDIARAAAEALGRIGPAAGRAVEALIPMARRGDSYGTWAREALAGIGTPRAVDFLLDRLVKDDRIDMEVLTILSNMGPAGGRAVDRLAKLAADRHDGRVVGALVSLQAPPQRFVPALIQGLGHTDESVRRRSAEALGLTCSDAQPVVEALTAALKDKSVAVRDCSAKALIRIGPAAKDALALVLKLARKSPENGGIGMGYHDVVEDQAFDPYLGVMSRPPAGLAGRGKTFLPQLATCLSGPRREFKRRYAAWVISGIGPDAEPLVPALVEAWLSWYQELERRHTLIQLASAIGSIGPGAVAAVPGLRGSLCRIDLDEKPRLRKAIIDALDRIQRPRRPPAAATTRPE